MKTQANISTTGIDAAYVAYHLGEAISSGKGGWKAPCPAHDDHKPSLSITEAEPGKILVHCFAGCAQLDVIAALRLRGLWPERQTRAWSPGERSAWLRKR